MTPPTHHVGCTVELDVQEPAALAFQVAVATGPVVDEALVLLLDDEPLAPEVLATPHGGRIHRLDVGPGRLTLDYRATVTSTGARREPELAPEVERLLYLRPSRYCPSDRLAGWVAAELGDVEGREAAAAVEAWIHGRIDYVLGSSGPLDDAGDTLLAGQGVCRDFAHLGVTMCRALDVPARLVAVYAPGLDPMDFHAVFEAHVEGEWHLFDATRLAPRSSLVRIATGRDAADTAFLSSYQGRLELLSTSVLAVVEGDLPVDDRSTLATLA